MGSPRSSALETAQQALGGNPCLQAGCETFRDALEQAPTAAFTDAPTYPLTIRARQRIDDEPLSPAAGKEVLNLKELPSATIVRLAIEGPVGIRCGGPDEDGKCGMGRVICALFT